MLSLRVIQVIDTVAAGTQQGEYEAGTIISNEWLYNTFILLQILRSRVINVPLPNAHHRYCIGVLIFIRPNRYNSTQKFSTILNFGLSMHQGGVQSQTAYDRI
jgi:hypothetical protein